MNIATKVVLAAKAAFDEYHDMADFWEDIEEWTVDCAVSGQYADLLENLSQVADDYGLEREDYPDTYAFADLLCNLITGQKGED